VTRPSAAVLAALAAVTAAAVTTFYKTRLSPLRLEVYYI